MMMMMIVSAFRLDYFAQDVCVCVFGRKRASLTHHPVRPFIFHLVAVLYITVRPHGKRIHKTIRGGMAERRFYLFKFSLFFFLLFFFFRILKMRLFILFRHRRNRSCKYAFSYFLIRYRLSVGSSANKKKKSQDIFIFSPFYSYKTSPFQ
jgi:hypothetical protein